MAATLAIFLALCIFTYSVSSYEQGDSIPLYYNKLFSLKTQLVYPYSSLDFICSPTHSSAKTSWYFDRDLLGDRLVASDYKINFLENPECKLLCKQSINVENAIQIQELVEDEYMIEWELDGLPGATVSYSNEAPEHNYKVGFPLGFKQGDRTYINNHIIFQILYTPQHDIIGFEIYPDSIAEGECTKKNVDYEYQEITGRRTQVSFTYSVQWKQVEASRWDAFLFKPNKDRHHQSVINGLIVISLITCAVFFILYKTKDTSLDDKDFKLYDDADDFIGWKLISRDVFRRPLFGGLLTPILGGGIQLVLASLGTLLCLYLGWYHPAQPGSFTRYFSTLYLLSGVPGGYWSARIYKVFRGKSWILNSILTALVVPSVYLTILFVYSMVAWSQQSSLAISFSGWVSMVSVCLFVLVPLTVLGAYLGERVDRIEYPTRTTQIPRMVPKKQWYQLPIFTVLASGIVPFSLAFLDWNEYLVSMTRGEYTLSIDYLVYISVFFLICTSEITIVFIFLHLCSEDYHWWWHAFMVGGASSVYMFAYSMLFLFKNTEIEGLIGCFIYTVQMVVKCSLIGLCTGTLGFISSYLFIKRIYSTTKRD